jgi:hypothetical protein
MRRVELNKLHFTGNKTAVILLDEEPVEDVKYRTQDFST